MRLPRPAHRKTIAAILSNYFSSASMPSIVALLVLSLLGAAAGCKKNTSTAEEQPSAAAPIPAPVAKPAVAAQPTPASELPDWKPVSATTATIEIPVVKGLLEDSAISSVNGDLENFDKILDMNPTTITKEVEDEIAPKTPGGHPQNLNGPPAAPGKGKVLIDVADMASSHRVVLFFHNNQTQHYPGSLDRGISTETLNGLRAGKVVEWQNSVDFGQALLQAQKGHRPPTMLDWADLNLTQCNLQRVEPVDLAAPVLVNNEPVELPALHAKCVLDNGTENHFYILNQPSNPLFLYTKMAISGDSSGTLYSSEKSSRVVSQLASLVMPEFQNTVAIAARSGSASAV